MKTLVLPTTHILVFKTDIRFDKDMPDIEQVMSSIPNIYKWNVDHHDVDNILRIEASNLISEEIISAMHQAGFICIELED